MRKQLPHSGDKRIIRRFALLPITCSSKERAWMEFVKIEQQYHEGFWDLIMGSGGWYNLRFVDESQP